VIFEVLTVVKMMMFFWVVTPFQRNIGIYLQIDMALQRRTTTLSSYSEIMVTTYKITNPR
jgi:hypothetical protein